MSTLPAYQPCPYPASLNRASGAVAVAKAYGGCHRSGTGRRSIWPFTPAFNGRSSFGCRAVSQSRAYDPLKRYWPASDRQTSNGVMVPSSSPLAVLFRFIDPSITFRQVRNSLAFKRFNETRTRLRIASDPLNHHDLKARYSP
jgi:hypothetical protein